MDEIDNIYFMEDEDFFCSLVQYNENNNKLKERQTLTFVDSPVSTSIIDGRSDW